MTQPYLMPSDEGSDAAILWRERGPSSDWALNGSLRGEAALPRIAVLLIGDGRDELRARTVESFLDKLYGYQLEGVVQIDDRRHEMGFGGAIRAGWFHLHQLEVQSMELHRERPWDYVFHLEEDWLFLEPIDMRALADILDGDSREQAATPPSSPIIRDPHDFPRIAQAALKRGPVNPQERAAGGVVEQWPHEYEDCGVITSAGATPYLQHRLFFTTNPSLYRTELMMLGWPDGPNSEARFTEELLAWGYAFAYYGSRQSAPAIEHLGQKRTGGGY